MSTDDWGLLYERAGGAIQAERRPAFDGGAAAPVHAWMPIEAVPTPFSPGLQRLLPPELMRSVASRQRAFVAGRLCAHRLLADAGSAVAHPLGRGALGESAWPSGWRGSISHTRHLACAVIMPAAHGRGVGIDVEELVTCDVAAAIRHHCVSDAEWQLLGADDDRLSATLAFSAKEAIYKATAPLVGRFFGFDQAVLTEVDRAARSLHFCARAGGPLAAVVPCCRVHWELEGDALRTLNVLA